THKGYRVLLTLTRSNGEPVPFGATASVDTHKGYRVLLTLTRSNGEPVPFGATASVDGQDANLASIVGDKGQVFLSGLPEEGLLLVNWGSASCRADYRLDISKNMNGIVMANAVCQ
ncbi:FimD/PapC C-terminal domain-containing protein, partial [Salmonella enterica]|uniref:FimD/PapC C-terminal domain-containing protein n=1 Tax=Salmonella enterica TaxID=28901 RepID=UPI002948BC45